MIATSWTKIEEVSNKVGHNFILDVGRNNNYCLLSSEAIFLLAVAINWERN